MTVRIEAADVVRIRQMISERKALSENETRALDISLAITSSAWLGLYEDKVVCAWGLIPPTLLSETAHLWLYATEETEEHKFLFVRYSQRVVELLLQDYPLITGLTDPRMPGAVRWLKWLGAIFGEPIGPYVPFTIRKKPNG